MYRPPVPTVSTCRLPHARRREDSGPDTTHLSADFHDDEYTGHAYSATERRPPTYAQGLLSPRVCAAAQTTIPDLQTRHTAGGSQPILNKKPCRTARKGHVFTLHPPLVSLWSSLLDIPCVPFVCGVPGILWRVRIGSSTSMCLPRCGGARAQQPLSSSAGGGSSESVQSSSPQLASWGNSVSSSCRWKA